jgi:hypothetical protein
MDRPIHNQRSQRLVSSYWQLSFTNNQLLITNLEEQGGLKDVAYTGFSACAGSL